MQKTHIFEQKDNQKKKNLTYLPYCFQTVTGKKRFFSRPKLIYWGHTPAYIQERWSIYAGTQLILILIYIFTVWLAIKSTSRGIGFHWYTFIWFNPFNAKATFVLSTRDAKIFEKHLNLVMLVFIRKLSVSTLIWVPICQGFSHFTVFFCIILYLSNKPPAS